MRGGRDKILASEQQSFCAKVEVTCLFHQIQAVKVLYGKGAFGIVCSFLKISFQIEGQIVALLVQNLDRLDEVVKEEGEGVHNTLGEQAFVAFNSSSGQQLIHCSIIIYELQEVDTIFHYLFNCETLSGELIVLTQLVQRMSRNM